jgi:hypothetical protein
MKKEKNNLPNNEITKDTNTYYKEPTLEELEKEMDHATLEYLEAAAAVHDLEGKADEARWQLKHTSGIFNEAKCRYLAAKLGIKREVHPTKKSTYTVNMSYAK